MNNESDAGRTGSGKQTPSNMEMNDLNSIDQQFISAKSYLSICSTKTGHNLYDHLSSVLTKVLDERPENVCDIFEDVSKETKKNKFTSQTDTIQNRIDHSTEVALAQVQKKLFSKGDDDAEQEQDEEVDTPLPNLMELTFFFEQAAVGLNREEVVRVWLALKNLVDNHPLQHVRFWGKIFGTEQNYYVAEVEFREGEEEEEEEEEQEETAEDDNEKEIGDEDDDEEQEEDNTPQADFKPPPNVPREDNRTGTNKKTYFVCNDPGKPWVKLPAVTPLHISLARQIKKFFTGRLDAPVVSYPPFVGNEANYLRGQIARISAGTHISPLGFYQFDEELEDEEEGEGRDHFVENLDFEGISVKDLVDQGLGHWVHHVQHVLPQGRCSWWNPVQKNEDDFEEDEEEEEREEPDEPAPEVGPPLLTPLAEDEEIGGNMPAWTPRLSSNLIPQYSIAVMHSNLWPGSHAFAYEKKFENIYVGHGHKYKSENYSPPHTAAIQDEFPSGPEITETDDPSPEEEAALRAAQIEAAEAAEEMDEEEEGDEDDDL